MNKQIFKLIKKYNTRDKEFGYNRSDGGDCGSKGAFNAQLKRIRKVYQYIRILLKSI